MASSLKKESYPGIGNKKHLKPKVADMIRKGNTYDEIVRKTDLSKTTIRIYRRELEKEGLLPEKVRKGLPVEFDKRREDILKMLEEGMKPGEMLRTMGLPYSNRALALFSTWRSRKKLPSWKKNKAS
ncbi:hypothetical protein [Runella sp.]|uniref:hypothetical protein n=1 Tax=Runella sp. TaxID=1960881 RepID=UPI003D10FFAD